MEGIFIKTDYILDHKVNLNTLKERNDTVQGLEIMLEISNKKVTKNFHMFRNQVIYF